MYVCDNPVCDPICDFCWFCEHNKSGIPIRCKNGHADDFNDGLGYCDDFKCALHEEKPQ